jgi:anti-sigma-K factor RskA
MIAEDKQDLAVEYAFGMMGSAAERAFEAELKTDEELRAFAMGLRESAAAMAHDAPALLPPPELRERILSQVRGELAVAAAVAAASSLEQQASLKQQASKGTSSFGFLPWAIAAGLAITSAALWTELSASKAEAFFFRTEANRLRQQDALKQMKIATLSAQNEAFAKAGAVVVWDEEKQRGVIKLTNFPPPANGKDYQLWVIDSKKGGAPVSGGVVPVSADGVARVSFIPDQPIRKADKFAISIEREGGAPKVAGPIVLVGD